MFTIRDTDSVFWWTREPRRDWVRQLARIAPPKEHLSHLVLTWFAGTLADPLQRWVICEATPLEYVPQLLPFVAELDVNSGADARYSANFFQRTGCILSPFWVIQGSDIGHAYKYSVQESQARASMGLPGEVPKIGKLRYAEPTDRTWPVLAQRSLIRRYHWLKLAKAHDEREKDFELARRRGVIAAADATVEATQDAVNDIVAGGFARRYDDRTLADGNTSELEAQYLETGTLPPDPVIRHQFLNG